MKKFFKGLICSMCIVLCMPLMGCGGNEIIVHTNPAFAPFEYMKGGDIVGVDVDIMNLVGKELGRKVKYVSVDFDPIVDSVAAGKVADVGAAGITITDSRKEKVDFSVPYYTSVQYVIYNKGDTYFESALKTATNDTSCFFWTDLMSKKIGVQRGTTGALYVEDEIEGGVLDGKNSNDLILYDDVTTATTFLKSNIDCIVVDELPAKYLAKNDKFACAALYYDADTATMEDYAICVTKGKNDILDGINKVLNSLLADVDTEGNNGVQRLVKKHLGL